MNRPVSDVLIDAAFAYGEAVGAYRERKRERARWHAMTAWARACAEDIIENTKGAP